MDKGIYKSKIKPFSGGRWVQVSKKAYRLYNNIKARTKRRTYIRSAYFKGEKIFLEIFWRHLHQKENLRDKTRRVKYLPCAIELIENSYVQPETKPHPKNHSETVHRFTGITSSGMLFRVQIKEDKNGGLWLMSIFPYDK
ncbi:MAG: hypothetical protein HYV41_04125 [Candidatus Magasanikbacteria bacterium]|nr:hypothetical protein [Candidatus Magasanikbacteria bacterium]